MNLLTVSNSLLDWHLEDYAKVMREYWPEVEVSVVDRTHSSNDNLRDKIRANNCKPTLLIAQTQTAGRGRQGRTWVSFPGALMFSLALPLNLAHNSGLSLAIGVALAQALDNLSAPTFSEQAQNKHYKAQSAHLSCPSLCKIRIGLKWPNDLWLIDGLSVGRKLGGILLESLVKKKTRWLIIGIGLNIKAPSFALLKQHDFIQKVASLEELLTSVTAPQVLKNVLPSLLQAISQFNTLGFLPFLSGYAERDVLYGRRITISGLTSTTEGLALGVGPQGALRIQTAHRLDWIEHGDVSICLAAPPNTGRSSLNQPIQTALEDLS